eukprot:12900515-Prorocentrum_lima.AAC.1
MALASSSLRVAVVVLGGCLWEDVGAKKKKKRQWAVWRGRCVLSGLAGGWLDGCTPWGKCSSAP